MGKETDGSLPVDPVRQIELVFQHLITLAEMAGGDKDSIAHINVVGEAAAGCTIARGLSPGRC